VFETMVKVLDELESLASTSRTSVGAALKTSSVAVMVASAAQREHA
jgi:hypothetical protein